MCRSVIIDLKSLFNLSVKSFALGKLELEIQLRVEAFIYFISILDRSLIYLVLLRGVVIPQLLISPAPVTSTRRL